MTETKQHGFIDRTNGTDADLIVIGGGSAGFAAAIRGHELGATVIMVNEGVIGGTCVMSDASHRKRLFGLGRPFIERRISASQVLNLHPVSRISERSSDRKMIWSALCVRPNISMSWPLMRTSG